MFLNKNTVDCFVVCVMENWQWMNESPIEGVMDVDKIYQQTLVLGIKLRGDTFESW